jgi:hypothetical protein
MEREAKRTRLWRATKGVQNRVVSPPAFERGAQRSMVRSLNVFRQHDDIRGEREDADRKVLRHRLPARAMVHVPGEYAQRASVRTSTFAPPPLGFRLVVIYASRAGTH